MILLLGIYWLMNRKTWWVFQHFTNGLHDKSYKHVLSPKLFEASSSHSVGNSLNPLAENFFEDTWTKRKGATWSRVVWHPNETDYSCCDLWCKVLPILEICNNTDGLELPYRYNIDFFWVSLTASGIRRWAAIPKWYLLLALPCQYQHTSHLQITACQIINASKHGFVSKMQTLIPVNLQ